MDKMTVKLMTTAIKTGFVVIPFLVVKYKSKKRESALQRFDEVYHNEDYNSALWQVDKYIEENPKDAIAYIHRGMTLSELDRFSEAVDSFEKSIELDPKVYESHKILADLYSNNANNEASIQYYDAAIKIKKDSIALFNRGVAYYHLGRFELAEKDLKKALRKEKKDKKRVIKQLLYLYEDMQEDKKADKYRMMLDK